MEDRAANNYGRHTLVVVGMKEEDSSKKMTHRMMAVQKQRAEELEQQDELKLRLDLTTQREVSGLEYQKILPCF